MFTAGSSPWGCNLGWHLRELVLPAHRFYVHSGGETELRSEVLNPFPVSGHHCSLCLIVTGSPLHVHVPTPPLSLVKTPVSVPSLAVSLGELTLHCMPAKTLPLFTEID